MQTVKDNSEKRCYKLFIDELGNASFKHPSELYILSGCSIDESERNRMKIVADRIKFKYWGHTDIVFHSREIGRKDGDFKIFKDRGLYKSFLHDIEDFLSNSNFKMFFLVVDKKNARRIGWNDIKIYKDTTSFIIKNFLLILLSNDSRGEVIIESATAEKDFYFHRALGHFVAEGLRKPKVNHSKVQDTLTSISFVSKKNHDIEEQVADLFAHAAKCKYLKKTHRPNTYEGIILKILKKKIFKIPRNAKPTKERFFKEVEPFKVLP
jgi:hypothetical protein